MKVFDDQNDDSQPIFDNGMHFGGDTLSALCERWCVAKQMN